jgi:hypothetical protein
MYLTLDLLTTTIVAPTSNASKWQMGFNSVFKGLSHLNMSLFLDTLPTESTKKYVDFPTILLRLSCDCHSKLQIFI